MSQAMFCIGISKQSNERQNSCFFSPLHILVKTFKSIYFCYYERFCLASVKQEVMVGLLRLWLKHLVEKRQIN